MTSLLYQAECFCLLLLFAVITFHFIKKNQGDGLHRPGIVYSITDEDADVKTLGNTGR
jgi:hypothetical protein